MGAFKDMQINDEAVVTNEAIEGTFTSQIQPHEGGSETNTMISIPLNAITTDFNNTRRNNKQVKQANVEALKQSISRIGLISAITVKDLGDGKYQLVSGFTRYAALKELDYQSVNAIVLAKDDDSHVLEANIAENMVRKGLSLGEQSSAIKRLFTILEGDKEHKIDQISVRLNLSKKAVKDRLILTSLSQDGLDAFDDGKIALKTAIVLAGLIEDEQTQYLSKLVEGTLTHEGLIEAIGQATISLSLAKFDTHACQQCPSNSQLQGSLFDDVSPDDSQATCSNVACFKQKSKTWYDDRVDTLSPSYGVLIPVMQVDRNEVNPITSAALGEAQLTQCASCANNVALIQNKMGPNFGDIKTDICNNKSCFSACASAHQQALNATVQESESTPDKAETAVSASSSNDSTTQKPSKPVATATMSRAAREATRASLASIQLDKGLSDQRDLNMLALLGALRLTGASHDSIQCMQEAATLEPDALQDKITTLLASYLSKSTKEKGEGDHDRPIGNVLIGLLNGKSMTEEAIVASWTPAHLKHTTKAGMTAILTEAGFDKAYDKTQKKGAFTALMNSKVDLIHKAVAKSDFDFTNFAPKSYITYARKVASSVK